MKPLNCRLVLDCPSPWTAGTGPRFPCTVVHATRPSSGMRSTLPIVQPKRRRVAALQDAVARSSAFTGMLLLLLATTTTASDSSANWPQFRGPGAMGVADHQNLPDQWSTNENVTWRIE